METTVGKIEKASIPVPFAKIKPQRPANDGFTLCKIYVHGIGKNRNYSYMDEEKTREALPTLPYAPVIGHLLPKYNEEGEQVGYYFGSHDYEVTDDLTLKPLTVPFGVVIDDSFNFEDVAEYGKTVRYLTCLAYLWTGRWPELKEAVYSEDVWFNQSMEVTDIQYRPLEEDSNYAEFLSWKYSALCLLGKSDDPDYHSEPCFISARVEPVKFDLANNEFDRMMSEMKFALAHCFDKQTNEKGGDHLNQEERDAIFAKFNLKAEDVDFEITEDMSAEQLEEKLQAYKDLQEQDTVQPEEDQQNVAGAEENEEDPKAEEAEIEVETAKSFSLTFSEKNKKLDELCMTLSISEKDHERYCWLNDFDDDFVYYTENIWANGDFTREQKRCKYELPELGDAKFVGTPEEVFLKWLTAAEINKLNEDREQLDALMKFKADIEKANHEAEVNDLFDEFEQISTTEEFSALREKADEYSVADLETQLFAIVGRHSKIAKKAQPGVLHVGVIPEEVEADDGYGGLIERGRNQSKRNII